MSTSSVSVPPATQGIKPRNPANSAVETALLRRILLVEPDTSLLSAENLLLSQSNYSVTPAFSYREMFLLRNTKPFALAIISDSLGRSLLGAVAETVRRQWPLARILILGRAATMLEDQLYDEQVERSQEPKQLLDDLERLYKDSWNQRSNTLAWKGDRPCACPARRPLESDPTKGLPAGVTDTKNLRGTPSGIMWRGR